MIDGKNVLAVITARGGSKGLKGKNIKHLCGKPLIGWPIEAAKGSRYVDTVMVTTDSKDIADVAVSYQAKVPFLRPAHLASDEAGSIDVVEHAIRHYRSNKDYFDYVVLLEPTSPLTTSDDIDNALEQLINNLVGAKAIVGVTENEAGHPAFSLNMDNDGKISPFLNDFSNLRRQELNSCLRLEGSLYISEVGTLLARRNFYHQDTLGYLVPKWKSFEIDDITDFYCIEAIINNLAEIKAMDKC